MRQHLLWETLSFTCLIKLKETYLDTYLDYCSFALQQQKFLKINLGYLLILISAAVL